MKKILFLALALMGASYLQASLVNGGNITAPLVMKDATTGELRIGVYIVDASGVTVGSSVPIQISGSVKLQAGTNIIGWLGGITGTVRVDLYGSTASATIDGDVTVNGMTDLSSTATTISATLTSFMSSITTTASDTFASLTTFAAANGTSLTNIYASLTTSAASVYTSMTNTAAMKLTLDTVALNTGGYLTVSTTVKAAITTDMLVNISSTAGSATGPFWVQFSTLGVDSLYWACDNLTTAPEEYELLSVSATGKVLEPLAPGEILHLKASSTNGATVKVTIKKRQ